MPVILSLLASLLTCQPCMLGLGALGLVGGAYVAGVRHERKVWEAADLQAKLDAAKRDANAQQTAAVIADQQAKELEQENSELQQKVTDYAEKLSKVPLDARCGLNADDIKQLRLITR